MMEGRREVEKINQMDGVHNKNYIDDNNNDTDSQIQALSSIIKMKKKMKKNQEQRYDIDLSYCSLRRCHPKIASHHRVMIFLAATTSTSSTSSASSTTTTTTTVTENPLSLPIIPRVFSSKPICIVDRSNDSYLNVRSLIKNNPILLDRENKNSWRVTSSLSSKLSRISKMKWMSQPHSENSKPKVITMSGWGMFVPRGGGEGGVGGGDSSSDTFTTTSSSSSNQETGNDENNRDIKSQKKHHNSKTKKTSSSSSSSSNEPQEQLKKDNTDKKNSHDKGRKNSNTNTKTSNSSSQHRTNRNDKSNNKQSSTSTSIVNEIMKETDYYKILGFTTTTTTTKKKITSNEIQKAYRRRALITHPDKTGDRTAFDKIAEAYDVLSNEQKRTIYDQYGYDGYKKHAQYGGDSSASAAAAAFTSADDIFRTFFGNTSPFFHFHGTSSPRNKNHRNNVNRTVRYQLEVSLEDMYHGTKRTIQIQQPSYDPFRRNQHNTNNRNGKQIEIDIPQGAIDGQSILLSGAMDGYQDDQNSENDEEQNQQSPPGDLILILRQREHPIYTRKGYDLAIRLDISLSDSLCGFQKIIQHLNGQTILIQSAMRTVSTATTETTSTINGINNEDKQQGIAAAATTTTTSIPILVESGDVQVLKGYGMPKDMNSNSFGDLYIQFHVDVSNLKTTIDGKKSSSSLPLLTPEEMIELRRLLRKIETGKVEDNDHNANNNETNQSSVNELQEANLSDFGRDSGQPSSQTSSDYDDHNHNNGFSSSFSSNSGNGSRNSFYWSSSNHNNNNPFTSHGATDPFGFFNSNNNNAAGVNDNDDGTTQCRQM